MEVRKQAQWEKIIRFELGEPEDALDVSLRFEADSLRWKVETRPGLPSGASLALRSRNRLVHALRAAGKPVA